MIFDLVRDFADVLDAMPERHSRRRILKLLDEAIRRDVHFIDRHPTTFFQCMWNTCWWYDCPGEERYYKESELIRGPSQRSGRRLHERLEGFLAAKNETTPDFFWIRSLRPPLPHLGSAIRAVLQGSTTRITCVAWSPDGSRIACGAEDGSLHVWAADSFQQLFSQAASGFEINGVAFSPCGRILGCGGTRIRLWDPVTGTELLEPPPPRGCGYVRTLAFSPDGKYLAADQESEDDEYAIVLWNLETGQEVCRMVGHEYHIESIAFHPVEDRLVSGSGDYTVRIWDWKKGRELKRIHVGTVSFGIAFSPDGRQLITGGSDNAARVWDAETGNELWQFLGHNGWVRSVAVAPNGKTVATGSIDGMLCLLDADKHHLVSRLQGHTGWVSDVAFSPDGKHVVSASVDHSLIMWDVERAISTPARTLIDHAATLRNLCVSSDGGLIASTADDDTVRVWNANDGTHIRTFTNCKYESQTSFFSSRFSPCGRYLLALRRDYRVRAWDIRTGHVLPLLEDSTFRIFRAVFAPDGESIAAACEDCAIRILQFPEGRLGQLLTGHEYWVTNVAFAPGGKVLASCSDAGSDRSVRLWDVASGIQIACLRHERCGFEALAFSSEGKHLAASALDDTIHVWNTQTFERVAVLGGHQALVSELAFSDDGTNLISRSRDGTCRIWPMDGGAAVVISGSCDPGDIGSGRLHRVIASADELWVQHADTGAPVGWFRDGLDGLRVAPSGSPIAGARGNHIHVLRPEIGRRFVPASHTMDEAQSQSSGKVKETSKPCSQSKPAARHLCSSTIQIELEQDRFVNREVLETALTELRIFRRGIDHVEIPEGKLLTDLKQASDLRMSVNHTAALEAAVLRLITAWLEGAFTTFTSFELADCLHWTCRIEREDQLRRLSSFVPLESQWEPLARRTHEETRYGPPCWGPSSIESPNAAVFFGVEAVSAVRLDSDDRSLRRVIIDHSVRDRILYGANNLAEVGNDILIKFVLPQCCGLSAPERRTIDFVEEPLAHWRAFDEPDWRVGLARDAEG